MSDLDYEQIKRDGEPTYWWASGGGMMRSDDRYTADEFAAILSGAFQDFTVEIQGEDRVAILRRGLQSVFGGYDRPDGTNGSMFKSGAS